MATNCSVPKDWAKLSSDLLPLIAHKLGDIIDFIRFRAVCKQWRPATNLSDNPPQFPWLMMVKLDRNPNISFHALPSSKIISGPFLEYITISCYPRRSNEFMIEEKDEKDPSLLVDKFPTHVFPLTVNKLDCNVISGCDQVIHLPVPVGNISKFLYTLISGKMKRLVVVVPLGKIFAHYRGWNFKFATTGKALSTIVNVSDLYGAHIEQVVDVSDGPTGKVVSTISCPVEGMCDSCLISTRDGLLMVSKKYISSHQHGNKPYYDYEFVVHRLENYDIKHPNWTNLSRIGDMMLFMDNQNAFSLMASEYDHDRYRGNCIYFITELKKDPQNYIVAGYDMGERRSFEVCSLGEYTTYTELFWFIPSLV
ncbi:hypothetical protein FCM35_KLT02042 [Carex littledalei]|uniref:KIB1-4 beta-propeller domain-containing protein n=1 Tax=Carex littledalei TaxID=544730 RepID=A0A833QSF6_9POAL|nr:hypothetical protein FCM35_KLT02042 [Carex littledalei]